MTQKKQVLCDLQVLFSDIQLSNSRIIQRQYEEDSMIEMEFQGLKYLKLFPADERYSCEILDSNIILKEDCIIWSDCEDKTELEDGDTGTLVCASKLRWRSIFGYMGEKNYW